MHKYVIDNISFKKHVITESEKDVINKALVSYNIVLGQYEKYTNDMKQKDLEKLQKSNFGGKVQNPFAVNMNKSYDVSLEDVKRFVYSSWLDAVVNVKLPLVCDGKHRRLIYKKCMRDIKNGKFINKKVYDTMQEFIMRLS